MFRAGRVGASTDHDSILFDMDLATGEILKGTTNMHWYQLGPKKILTTPWLCLNHSITKHPDSGAQITGSYWISVKTNVKLGYNQKGLHDIFKMIISII